MSAQRRRCLILLLVAHVPFSQAIHHSLQEYRAKLFGNRKRRLLVPQITKVVALACEGGIVEEKVALFGPSNPIKPWRLGPDKFVQIGWRYGFGDHPEKRTLAGV